MLINEHYIKILRKRSHFRLPFFYILLNNPWSIFKGFNGTSIKNDDFIDLADKFLFHGLLVDFMPW